MRSLHAVKVSGAAATGGVEKRTHRAPRSAPTHFNRTPRAPYRMQSWERVPVFRRQRFGSQLGLSSARSKALLLFLTFAVSRLPVAPSTSTPYEPWSAAKWSWSLLSSLKMRTPLSPLSVAVLFARRWDAPTDLCGTPGAAQVASRGRPEAYLRRTPPATRRGWGLPMRATEVTSQLAQFLERRHLLQRGESRILRVDPHRMRLELVKLAYPGVLFGSYSAPDPASPACQRERPRPVGAGHRAAGRQSLETRSGRFWPCRPGWLS